MAASPAQAAARSSAMSARRAAVGGPIALVEQDDLIQIDVPGRKLAIVGVKGEPKTPKR